MHLQPDPVGELMKVRATRAPATWCGPSYVIPRGVVHLTPRSIVFILSSFTNIHGEAIVKILCAIGIRYAPRKSFLEAIQPFDEEEEDF